MSQVSKGVDLPGVIVVTNHGLFVDGEKFPFPVAVSPAPEVAVDVGDVPAVRLTLLAEQVEVDWTMP